ncbi:hypothetical protein AB0383_20125 [Amycolatopsis sp. NPDC051373]|uniref:hypothetical protein n=1 Tax=Amycolatopsis sp. NPDC051373 TaxID=3155801 RepID=UPI00344D43E1
MTLPIELQVTRFKCPFCPKSYSKRTPAQAHIDRCWTNPGARSCKTCVHRIEPDEDYGYVTDEGCQVGVELPTLEHRVGVVTTLPILCPKWEPSVSQECEASNHDDCPGHQYFGQCYCSCHSEGETR